MCDEILGVPRFLGVERRCRDASCFGPASAPAGARSRSPEFPGVARKRATPGYRQQRLRRSGDPRARVPTRNPRTSRNPEEVRGTPRTPRNFAGNSEEPEELRGTPRNSAGHSEEPEELRGTPRHFEEPEEPAELRAELRGTRERRGTSRGTPRPWGFLRRKALLPVARGRRASAYPWTASTVDIVPRQGHMPSGDTRTSALPPRTGTA
jgi:hypothetical protein